MSVPTAVWVAIGVAFVAHDVREFVRTGAQVAIVEIKGHEPKQVANTIRYYIKKHPETCAEIGCALRGGVAYLYRKEGR